MRAILHGGKRPIKVKMKRGKYLGGAGEGKIFETKVRITKNGKTRTITMAEKRFFRGKTPKNRDTTTLFRNPEKQFKIAKEIRELNNRKKLGLHILPTVRLRKRLFQKPTLITTRYRQVIGFKETKRELLKSAEEQKKKEEEILLKEGYFVGNDCWKLIKDPLTGNPLYYIADFGGIIKIDPAMLERLSKILIKLDYD